MKYLSFKIKEHLLPPTLSTKCHSFLLLLSAKSNFVWIFVFRSLANSPWYWFHWPIDEACRNFFLMPSLGFPHVIVSDSDSLSCFFPPSLPLLLRNIKRFRNGTRFVISYFNWIFFFLYWYAQVTFKWFTDVLPSAAHLTSFLLSLYMDSSNDTGKQSFRECATHFCNENPKWKARRHCHFRDVMSQSHRFWHSVSTGIGGHPPPCRVGCLPTPNPRKVKRSLFFFLLLFFYFSF